MLKFLMLKAQIYDQAFVYNVIFTKIIPNAATKSDLEKINSKRCQKLKGAQKSWSRNKVFVGIKPSLATTHGYRLL